MGKSGQTLFLNQILFAGSTIYFKLPRVDCNRTQNLDHLNLEYIGIRYKGVFMNYYNYFVFVYFLKESVFTNQKLGLKGNNRIIITYLITTLKYLHL